MLRRAFLLLVVMGNLPGFAADDPPEARIEDSDRDHWSFRPVVRSPLPQIAGGDRCRTPIDRFVFRKLEERELQPLPEADPLVLLRRVTFDLTGLPPTPDEIRLLQSDPSVGAYERAVDRLLASPAYGERAAQFWLDLARFAETDGFEHDKVRPEAWRYRDWVVRAFNADLPYGRFISEQLAGDELFPENPDAALATGFLLAGPDMPDINLQEERRHEFFNGMTANVGEVLLGLQFGCCQCHDHKTDPLSQYDFYRLRAVFDSLDVLGAMEKEEQSDANAPVARTGLRIARNFSKPPESVLALRGDFRRPGPVVEPGFPRVVDFSSPSPEGPNAEGNASSTSLTPAIPQGPAGRRSALARWITDPRNPLTARVIVNRIWQQHFGSGLVGTPSDFGLMGYPPTHPELLDWLAAEFQREGGSLKALHRLMVTSSVYRTVSRPVMAGEPRSAKIEERADTHSERAWHRLVTADPANELLGRMPRRRLEGEAIRDALLAVSGQLNATPGGPGVRPPLPPEVVGTLLKDQWKVTPAPSEHVRRSLYLFARRNLRFPLLDAFDKPDTNLSCPRRSTTTIAPQALHLLNSEFSRRCAERIASGLAAMKDRNAGIETCYRQLFGRPPTPVEVGDAVRFLGDGRDGWADLCLALMNTNEFLYLD